MASLTDVRAVSTLGDFTCLLVGGGVQCWGDNDKGQLGNGTLAASVGGATTPTTSLSSVIGLGPCCGGGDATFSSGLPGAARVSDLTASQFQTLCTASRGDTAGLDQYCKIPGLEAALAAPATASDSALVSACQASYATCTRSSPKDSPSACASVTTSTSCYVRVDELEACLNEMTALGAAYGPSLPDCATLTRASLGGVDQSLLIAAPSCGAIGGCTQILTSP